MNHTVYMCVVECDPGPAVQKNWEADWKGQANHLENTFTHKKIFYLLYVGVKVLICIEKYV